MNDQRCWTRRSVLRMGGVAAVGSAMAGCLDDGGSDDGNASNDAARTVSMPPVGDVEFDSVPETWAANNGSWADMGIALGQQPPEAVYLTNRYHTQYYDEIPDVSVDKSDMTALWEGELSPEEFLELSEEVDVFVMDPNFLTGRTDHWNEEDIEQIEATGTAFFGNSIFSRDYGWHDDYEYLTLYEAFGKLADVFQEEKRYEAFESLHERFQDDLEAIVPPEDERPDIAILWPAENDTFYPYTIDEGTSYKQWRDLGVTDALGEAGISDFLSDRGAIDYENLLEIDPDVLMLRSYEGLSADEFQDDVVSELESHDVASSLTAVENGDVYRGGPLYQGPITNLVVTQRAAEQVYGVDEQLYDPQAVSDIVNGSF